jgi:hypothetical protein
MAIDFSALFKRAGKAAAENSPVILTALAVTGTLSTAYLVASATVRAIRLVDVAEEEHFTEQMEDGVEHTSLSFQQKASMVWKEYIPAAASAALTVAAIVGVKAAGDRSAAAIAMAYKASEKAYTEYRESASEKAGTAKEQAIREAATQKRAEANPMETTPMVFTGKGETLVYDTWNDRYFQHDVELVRRAENDFNQRVIHDGSATLNDLWDFLGVNKTLGSDVVGWDTDKLLQIDYIWQTINGNPCLFLGFSTQPKMLYGTRY